MCDSKKRLNALKSTSDTRKRKLRELQTQYDQMIKDKSAAEELDRGESDAAQVGQFQIQSRL